MWCHMNFSLTPNVRKKVQPLASLHRHGTRHDVQTARYSEYINTLTNEFSFTHSKAQFLMIFLVLMKTKTVIQKISICTRWVFIIFGGKNRAV